MRAFIERLHRKITCEGVRLGGVCVCVVSVLCTIVFHRSHFVAHRFSSVCECVRIALCAFHN